MNHFKYLTLFLQIHIALSKFCRNEHGDTGICISSESCKEILGVPLGSCSELRNLVCCHELSCSINELERLELQKSSRKKRSTTVPSHIPITSIEPLCGFSHDTRLDQKMSQLSNQMRFAHLINGIEVHENSKYPWMLSIWKSSSEKASFLPTCGAGLIGLRHAITAAHCVNHKRPVVLRGGSPINRLTTSGGSLLSVESIDVHPEFNPFNFENDIALITLKEEISPSKNLFPVCLPPPVIDGKVSNYEGQEAFVTGYGCTSEKCGFGDLSRHLQEVSMEVISNDLAMCWFLNNSNVDAGAAEYVPKNLFITGGDESGDTTTCQGDSGSPVVRQIPTPSRKVQFEVIGLVSWSKGCGRKFRPSVWTRVESHVDWIRNQIAENSS